jgi:4,5-dihydroxyphthalate decarboxylase
MTEISLTTVNGSYGCTQALKDGSVAPKGFSLRFEEVERMPQAFRRMVRGLEFDVCEMAITTYLTAKAHGKPFTAIPVFPVRAFHHGAILRSTAVRAPEPQGLLGRRVGVNRGYTVTSGVWARGILADEYGLRLSGVTWVLSGDEHVEEFQRPPNVVPVAPGKDVPEMVASGELAAGVGVPPGEGLAPLIPDASEAGYRALRERGLYPINHLVVVKDELLAAHPDLAASLFTAYAESKNRYTAALHSGDVPDPGAGDRMYKRVSDITGADPLPYGLSPNRAMVEQIIRHALEQKILTDPVRPEDLFVPSTLTLNA